jgi:hypothetical protein
VSIKFVIRKNKVDDIASELDTLVASERKEVLEYVADLAKDLVHVITGDTRDSIRVNDAGEGVEAEHGAIWEELGTHDRAPHPFLTPAFEQGTADLGDRVGRRIEEAAR